MTFLGRMMSELLEFAYAVVSQWTALITGGVVTAIIIAYQQLTRTTISSKVYLGLLGLFFVWACFGAWTNVRTELANQNSENKELRLQLDDRKKQQEHEADQQRLRTDQINLISVLVDGGNRILKEFEEKNDADLIKAHYLEWEQAALTLLPKKFGVGYLNQFASARGTGMMLLNHSVEGGGWYSHLQGKLNVLNAFSVELRKGG
jgi:hypothetical protein